MDGMYSADEQKAIRTVHDAGPECLGCYFCETPDHDETGEAGA